MSKKALFRLRGRRLLSSTSLVLVRQQGRTPGSDDVLGLSNHFSAVFAWAFTSMQPIYPAEVMSNDMRAKGTFAFQHSFDDRS